MRRLLTASLLLALASACRTPPDKPSDGQDGLIDGSETGEDADGDGIVAADDCDDANPGVSPDAEEICDGIDNDCDGEVDEGVMGEFFTDADGDGFGDPTAPVQRCAAEAGEVNNAADCDDTNGAVFPGAPESCNGEDDDCDGVVDNDALSVFYTDADGDGHGDPAAPVEACALEPGLSETGADCDDTNPAISPDAAEVCNEVDDDCDEVVDEGVTTVFYADTDGDGYGAVGFTTEACSEPPGYAAAPGDCDDTDPAVSPDGEEVCNGTDDNCDGNIDEGTAAGATTWYTDADGDGYGDSALSTVACTAPSGTVADGADCDDADSAVNPAATEVCNEVDDDCDGAIDDTDSSLDTSTATAWYADADSDGYGASGTLTLSCSAPSGTVADGADCDDADSAVNPAATEVCNEVDDDCDGAIDDADSSLDTSTATPWYDDADGDGYGDSGTLTLSCDAPSGAVADDSDCDDTSALTLPGGTELWDGEDNDCDGTADNDLHIGSGGDGPLSVTGTTDLSTFASGTRTSADAVSYGVLAISGDTLTLDATAAGLATGDEVLLINLQGTDAAYAAVGTYELASVDSVSGATVTLLSSVAGTYGESSNTDLSGQLVLLQRVPHYTDVTIASSGLLTTAAWDGSGGGVLALRASGTVSIASGGAIAVDGLGYDGGATGSFDNCDAYQGESYAGLGEGDGDGVCTSYNETWGHWINNEGGGGAHITGAGGEHAGGATDGDSWTGGTATPPYAGTTYGVSTLTTLFFGSGGGGVWNGGTDTPGEDPGPGGAGGGILIVGASSLDAQGSLAITSLGADTDHWASGTWTYGAGGGAGGSIWLAVDTLTLAADSVDAQGGLGEASYIRAGGDGGEGRIRIDYLTCNGSTYGSVAAESALSTAVEPDPGATDTP